MIPGYVRTEGLDRGSTLAVIPGPAVTVWASVDADSGPSVVAIGVVSSEAAALLKLMKSTRPAFVAVHDLDSKNGERLFVAGLATMAAMSAGAFVADPEFARSLARADYRNLLSGVRPRGVRPRGSMERLAVAVALFASSFTGAS